MELIGSRFTHLNYYQAAGFAILCRHAVLLNAEFLNGFYTRLDSLATKHDWRNRYTIQHIVIGARAAAADTHVAFVSAGAKSTAASSPTRAAGLLRHPCRERKKTVWTTTAAVGSRLDR
jgi:hypothetical protein